MPITIKTEGQRTTIVMAGAVSLEDLLVFLRTSTAPLAGQTLLADLRQADLEVLLGDTTRDLAAIAAARAPDCAYGRVAIVVDSDTNYGFARAYATDRAATGLTIEVFRTIEDAEAWLSAGGVPNT